jgi:uncharacterized protein YjbJ (UPF0337 family)
LYIKECFGIDPPPSGTNSAYGYWSKFPNPLGTVFHKVENTSDLIPKEGWIAIWKPWTGNSYGHIAIVDEGSTKTVLVNDAQNWTSKVFQKEKTSYKNVVGYLVPNVIIDEDMNTTEENNILKFIREGIIIDGIKRDITEGDVRRGIGYITDNIDGKVKKLESKVETLTKNLKDLKDSLLVDGKDVYYWHSEYDSASAEIQTWKKKSLQASSFGDIVSELVNRLLKK